MNNLFAPKQENTHFCKLLIDDSFKKGETILAMSDMTYICGMLRKGRAHVSAIDSEGEEQLPALIEMGDCFGDFLIYSVPGIDYYLVADEDCDVTFINIKTAMNGCGRDCGEHGRLMKSLLLLSSRYARAQGAYISILSCRSTRERLMACFRYFAESMAADDSFRLPMSYANLANYLCVDRSAMMREIKRMNEEGLIRTDGRAVTIL